MRRSSFFFFAGIDRGRKKQREKRERRNALCVSRCAGRDSGYKSARRGKEDTLHEKVKWQRDVFFFSFQFLVAIELKKRRRRQTKLSLSRHILLFCPIKYSPTQQPVQTKRCARRSRERGLLVVLKKREKARVRRNRFQQERAINSRREGGQFQSAPPSIDGETLSATTARRRRRTDLRVRE